MIILESLASRPLFFFYLSPNGRQTMPISRGSMHFWFRRFERNEVKSAFLVTFENDR